MSKEMKTTVQIALSSDFNPSTIIKDEIVTEPDDSPYTTIQQVLDPDKYKNIHLFARAMRSHPDTGTSQWGDIREFGLVDASGFCLVLTNDTLDEVEPEWKVVDIAGNFITGPVDYRNHWLFQDNFKVFRFKETDVPHHEMLPWEEYVQFNPFWVAFYPKGIKGSDSEGHQTYLLAPSRINDDFKIHPCFAKRQPNVQDNFKVIGYDHFYIGRQYADIDNYYKSYVWSPSLDTPRVSPVVSLKYRFVGDNVVTYDDPKVYFNHVERFDVCAWALMKCLWSFVMAGDHPGEVQNTFKLKLGEDITKTMFNIKFHWSYGIPISKIMKLDINHYNESPQYQTQSLNRHFIDASFYNQMINMGYPSDLFNRQLPMGLGSHGPSRGIPHKYYDDPKIAPFFLVGVFDLENRKAADGTKKPQSIKKPFNAREINHVLTAKHSRLVAMLHLPAIGTTHAPDSYPYSVADKVGKNSKFWNYEPYNPYNVYSGFPLTGTIEHLCRHTIPNHAEEVKI